MNGASEGGAVAEGLGRQLCAAQPPDVSVSSDGRSDDVERRGGDGGDDLEKLLLETHAILTTGLVSHGAFPWGFDHVEPARLNLGTGSFNRP